MPLSKSQVQLTGNWELVASDGWSKSVTIATPLVKAARCKFFVSGTMDVVKDDAAFEVDFGDGSCDREATLTFVMALLKQLNETITFCLDIKKAPVELLLFKNANIKTLMDY